MNLHHRATQTADISHERVHTLAMVLVIALRRIVLHIKLRQLRTCKVVINAVDRAVTDRCVLIVEVVEHIGRILDKHRLLGITISAQQI